MAAANGVTAQPIVIFPSTDHLTTLKPCNRVIPTIAPTIA